MDLSKASGGSAGGGPAAKGGGSKTEAELSVEKSSAATALGGAKARPTSIVGSAAGPSSKSLDRGQELTPIKAGFEKVKAAVISLSGLDLRKVTELSVSHAKFGGNEISPAALDQFCVETGLGSTPIFDESSVNSFISQLEGLTVDPEFKRDLSQKLQGFKKDYNQKRKGFTSRHHLKTYTDVLKQFCFYVSKYSPESKEAKTVGYFLSGIPGEREYACAGGSESRFDTLVKELTGNLYREVLDGQINPLTAKWSTYISHEGNEVHLHPLVKNLFGDSVTDQLIGVVRLDIPPRRVVPV